MWRANGLPTTAIDDGPVAGLSENFAGELRQLGVTAPFALAVSGGGDSIALMHLTAAWAQECGIDPQTISVLTVDHGLRAGSRAEAERVVAWARGLGFSAALLSWTGDKPTSGIQAMARTARRQLLCGWCRRAGVGQLLLAHTIDDQIETIAMREARGSGPMGLAGMARDAGGPFRVQLVRPLLGVTRAELRTWLTAHCHKWIDDPSNEDDSFERVRVRKVLSGDEAAKARLAALSAEAAALRDSLDAEADDLMRAAVRERAGGWAEADLERFNAAPDPVRARALLRLLRGCGGGDHPPRRDRITRLLEALCGNEFAGATLAGCRIVAQSQDSALFGREARNLSPLALTARQWHLWDNRFEVWSAAPARVLPLGAVGLDAFAGEARDRVKAAAPPAFREAMPVAELASGALAVPHAGVWPEGVEEEELKLVFGGVRPFSRLSARNEGKSM